MHVFIFFMSRKTTVEILAGSFCRGAIQQTRTYDGNTVLFRTVNSFINKIGKNVLLYMIPIGVLRPFVR